MKINTKTATPVKNCQMSKVVENENVPSTTTDDESLGRALTFIPTMLWTPVLSSMRTKGSSPEVPRVVPDEMIDICSKLSELFVSVKEEEKGVFEEEKPKFGRYTTTVINRKTEKHIQVIRSLRLEA